MVCQSVLREFPNLSLTYHHLRSSQENTEFDLNRTLNVFGNEHDLIVDYKYDMYVDFQVGTAVFFPGDIFKQTHGKENSLFFYLSTSVKL